MLPKINKNILILVILLIPSIISFRLMRPGYFSMQDDMHVFRLQQLDQCLNDGQFPCRHISDGGLGYGYPLFNYYSPLPYAFAEIFHLAGFSYIDSLKITFIIPNYIRSVSMFLLGNAFFGPLGGLISSAIFTLAPYQAINSFVRGAIAENLAISLIPLIFWALYSSRYNIYILALSALFLSHNLTTLYTLPLLFIFSLLTKKLPPFLKNSFVSFLISSFFLIPAVFEKNLVTINTMTQGYFNYIIHFATLSQLFISRFWGYGASLWGPVDDMSFQIGYIQWIIPILVVIFTLISNKTKFKPIIFVFFAIGIFAVFLTHNKSTFIWQALPFMPYYQFPWRFLGLATFCFSFISGSIINYKIIHKFKLPITFIIIFITILLNYSYFKEDIWYNNLTDSQKLNTAETYRQSGAGLKDYWPSGTSEFPIVMAPTRPLIENGSATVINFTKKSNLISGQIDVTSSSATVTLPITNFPTWELEVNNQKTAFTIDPKLGQIMFTLKSGTNNFILNFNNTPIRILANLLSIIGIGIYIIKVSREKHS